MFVSVEFAAWNCKLSAVGLGEIERLRLSWNIEVEYEKLNG